MELCYMASARKMARYISLAYNCAAGTAREKEVIMPAKHWSVLIDLIDTAVLENKLTKGSKLGILVLWDNKGSKE